MAYKQPKLTVDIIIKCQEGVVLIERKNPPYGWAIPGGFVDYGETVEQSALRETKEETSLVVKNLKQFYVYSDPSRDPRGHTISVVFTGEAKGTPKAASDAKNIGIFTEATLPENIAFDHRRILDDYFDRREKINMKPQDYTRLTQITNKKWLYKNLTHGIIGAAMETHRELGSGFLEYVYEEALCYELKLRNISFERQKDIDVYYKDLLISKKYKADLLVENKVIVEIKATQGLTVIDEAQLLNYLKATKLRIGLLLNFGKESLEIKRRIL